MLKITTNTIHYLHKGTSIKLLLYDIYLIQGPDADLPIIPCK